jgi:hypothetical protein
MAEKFEKEIHELDHPNHHHGSAKTVEGLSEHEIDTIGGLRTVEVGLSADQVIVELDPAEQTRILRKVDYRLVPLLALLYLYVTISKRSAAYSLLFPVLPLSIEVTSEMRRLRASTTTSSSMACNTTLL